MNTRTNTIKRMIRAALFAVLSLGIFSAVAMAHGGEEHVIGTVLKVSPTAITVKTTAGKMVDVLMDTKTTFARADQPVQRTDIKVGDRIVIHAVEVDEKLTAHTVQVGTAVAKPK